MRCAKLRENRGQQCPPATGPCVPAFEYGMEADVARAHSCIMRRAQARPGYGGGGEDVKNAAAAARSPTRPTRPAHTPVPLVPAKEGVFSTRDTVATKDRSSR